MSALERLVEEAEQLGKRMEQLETRGTSAEAEMEPLRRRAAELAVLLAHIDELERPGGPQAAERGN
jgi:hypothetical protein